MQQRKDLHGTDFEAEQEWNTCHQEKLCSSQEAMGRKSVATVDQGRRGREKRVQHRRFRCVVALNSSSPQKEALYVKARAICIGAH